MRYKVIVFDWDGTIMDTIGIIVRCLQKGARRLGLPRPSRRACRGVIGMGWHQVLARMGPDLTPEQADNYVATFRKTYTRLARHERFYEGMPALLQKLKDAGYILTIATGKSRAGLDRVLNEKRVRHLFSTTCTADCYAGKPAPDMLEHIAMMEGVNPYDMVMVGDTVHDMGAARNMGCDAVAMLYGAQTKARLRPFAPKAFCSSVEELRAFFFPKKK